VECVGGQRLLSPLMVTVLSWGDTSVDVDFDLSTFSDACCGGVAPGEPVTAPAPPSADAGVDAPYMACTRSRLWDLGQGFQLSPSNYYLMRDSLRAYLNTTRGSVSAHVVSVCSREHDIWCPSTCLQSMCRASS
jgi:hypothetical protein